MFTTAGKTLPTAKTAGSDAGSACSKQNADPAWIKTPTTNRLNTAFTLSAFPRTERCLFRA
jgi:hypothetical protein